MLFIELDAINHDVVVRVVYGDVAVGIIKVNVQPGLFGAVRSPHQRRI
jgi:hypothetical protein